MATNATQGQAAPGKSAAAALGKDGVVRRKDAGNSLQKLSGYGLPCSKCHLYYSADLDACPICRHTERVPAVRPKFPIRAAQPAVEAKPAALEKEREEFLRQFKSQLVEAHVDAATGKGVACQSKEHRPGETAQAEVCDACYERSQDRVELLESALQFDLKEAAQIIYDAVWADPSEPAKTYQNAANALLTELRKRAGVNSATPFQQIPESEP